MLNIPTAFPLVGSYALYDQGGRTHLVRIQRRYEAGAATEALISFPGRWGASGDTRVPLADLNDGTPLDDAERAEFVALERALAAMKAPSRSRKFARYSQLRLRDVRADLLAAKLRTAGLASIAA